MLSFSSTGQSESVISDVNEIIERFMLESHTIIMAVVPANQDVATVDILERAHKFDPDGERTIGIITKSDCIERGNKSVIDVIRNISKPLKLGYIAVKNRGQDEIDSAVTIQQARENEVAFFREHSVYKDLPHDLLGVENLIATLTNALTHRIIAQMPAMIAGTDAMCWRTLSPLSHLWARRPHQAKPSSSM